MISILFTLVTLVICIPRVTAGPETTIAPPPFGTFGHTAVLSGNTVFIQGGTTSASFPSRNSYAIILDKDGSLNDATWLDTTNKTSTLTRRVYGAAVATDNTMIFCGTQDGTLGDLTCDQLDTRWYNATRIEPFRISNRYGMAATYQRTSDGIKAYFIGGSSFDEREVGTVNIVTMKTNTPSIPQWSRGQDMTEMAGVPRKFHTATWVDASLNGIVVMGGQANGIVVQPLAPVAVSDPRNSTWITVPVNLGALPSSDHNRYGHSAVSDGNGNIYIFGGIDSQGTVRNELFVLDTKQPRTNWALLFLLNAPEGRAFHTATLLPDNTMLIMWGRNDKSTTSAQSTFMIFDIGRMAWSEPKDFPNMVSIDPSGVPRSNNGPTGESGPSSEKSNLPLIIAICVLGGVLLILIIGLALYFCYFKRHRRTLPALHPGMNPEKDPTTLTSEQQEDKADQIRVLMSGMQRTMDPDNGGRHYNSKDESYNRQDAAGNGLGRLGPRAPQFAAVLHGPQNVEGHLPPQYGVDLNALQYDAGSRAPQQNAEPHGPRHEFQYDMSPRAPHYGVDPIDHRMPQFGAHSGALLYAAESRAPQRVGSGGAWPRVPDQVTDQRDT